MISQVVLSFALPLPMIALVLFTRRRDLMGEFVNGRLTEYAAIIGTVVILALNAVLLLQTFGVPVPGLPSSLGIKGSGRFLKKAERKNFFYAGPWALSATTPMTQH